MAKKKREILETGRIIILCFLLFLTIIASYIAIIRYQEENPNYHVQCANDCAQFNLTGIVYPDGPCQCFRPECTTPSEMGTLYYKCNESDLEFLLQTGMGLIG